MLTVRIRRPGTLHAATRLAPEQEAAVEVRELTEAVAWVVRDAGERSGALMGQGRG
jgi:hypothetical protein